MNDTTPAILLTEATASAYVAAAGFRVGPVGRVGVELEYCVRDPRRPSHRPAPAELLGLLAHLGSPLPGGSAVTVEPGGQLELSSSVGACLSDCTNALTADLALVRGVLAEHGLYLDGTGLDMARRPRLVTDHPRYVALAEYHDRSGARGRTVMTNSASIQVCLDAGTDGAEADDWSHFTRRWWLADAIGPVMMAAFANSPHVTRAGRRWVSYRQALRFGTDASRTRAPRRTGDPRQAWARYALAAKVAMVAPAGDDPAAAEPGARWHVPHGLTMRDWLRGHGPRPVTLSDLERHLGTLVPPVRPRGYLELRMLDQQAGDDWVVPAAVVTALLDDPEGAAAATAATEHLRSPLRRHRDWLAAARDGLADPATAAAALACFTAAQAVLARRRAPLPIRDAVASFADRYVLRGRCPADDAPQAPQRRPRRVGVVSAG
ncbi:glutamate-cysteine ligase family protein [Dactylosporangium matsuzakiense]|uniref:glutamate-cysteine ligase family protein n=1 Tax=Dactylosporangium matsuzakiense TaxID=53360 RepID=UPI0021C436FB|nr:glutamate-cysteine ligase family protein [Dactylosporangium matsuzakiense]UWZ49058.1 ergothioneine biosynthesis glutamate--cysteine ligase EgtA [Dactylosporangium matsuzakiense]